MLGVLFTFFIWSGVTGTILRAEDYGSAYDSVALPEEAEVQPAASSTTVTMKMNQKPEIKEIQQALLQAGYYKGTIDGIKGSKTRQAIRAFQNDNGLKVDGKVGSKTWEKLKEHLTESIKAESSIAKDLAVSEDTDSGVSQKTVTLTLTERLLKDSKELKQKLVS